MDDQSPLMRAAGKPAGSGCVHFTVRCDAHEATGPQIRRQTGATVLIGHPAAAPATGWSLGSPAWCAFLSTHEHCDLRLLRE